MNIILCNKVVYKAESLNQGTIAHPPFTANRLTPFTILLQ